MAIVRWDPFREMVTLRDRMNQLFDRTFQERGEEGGSLAAWSPSVDIRETEKALMIHAELPGVDDKDVDIEVEDHVLTLRGRREMSQETQREDYQRIERAYGEFFRSFTLPPYVDETKIEAGFDKGVLTITIPKKPEAKPKRIPIGKGAAGTIEAPAGERDRRLESESGKRSPRR